MCRRDGPCEGCLHFYGAYENNRCCNYIFDVGHSRPCPPAEGCSEYTAYTRENKRLRKATDMGLPGCLPAADVQ